MWSNVGLMRASSMFMARVPAALKMEASMISRNTFSTSLLRGFTPLPSSQRGSYILKITHQFSQRSLRRLYAYSSQPPLPLLLPKGEVKDDCVTEPSTTAAKPETSAGKSSMEGFQRASSSNDVPFKIFNRDPRSSSGRQRKRRAFVALAPKRLYSEEEDSGYMREALAEAKIATKKGEVPVGAVLVHKKKIIARFHNQVETSNDPTAHAEMLCIRSAAAELGSRWLTGVTMYVTSEPCPMCAWAILQGRVRELVWGAPNSLLGADGSWIKLFLVSSSSENEPKGKDYLHPFHRTITVRRGVLAEESADLMQTFFAMRRLVPKCTTDDAQMGVKSAPWPRSLGGWFPPGFKKLNPWVQRRFRF